jgi:hypothetical protein
MKAGDMCRQVLRRAQCGLAAALLPGHRRHGLLYQGGFPVGGRLDGPQVTRLHAVFAESYG